MINNELLTFIKERTAQGSTKEQITDMLVTHGGWDGTDVEEAFDTMNIASSSMKSAMSTVENNPPTVMEKKISEPEIKPIEVHPLETITPNLAPVELVKPIEVKTPVSIAPEVSATPITATKPPTISPFLSGEIKKESPQSTIVSETKVFPTSDFQKPSFGSAIRPVTPSTVIPKIVMPASPVYESPGFSTAPKPETAKTLEPTGTPAFASARLGTFQPKPASTPTPMTDASISDPFHQMKAPAIPEMVNEKETKTSGAFSLGNLRAKFSGEKKSTTDTLTPATQAKIESPAISKTPSFSPFPSPDKKASEKISEFGTSAMSPVKTPAVSHAELPAVSHTESPAIKTTSPFGSQGSELSPHLQSGMTPTPGAFAGVSPSLGIKKSVEPPKGVSVFTTGQKLPGAVPMPIQHSLIKRAEPPKGRKLLGTIMFLMGFVLGATGMHAYLNEYLNPVIDWAQTNIPGLSK